MDRVACYIRVSSQEQKLHGISLDAQRDKLKEYADKHDLKIVDWYEDEGVSGRKPIRQRPELQRMLIDAHDHKFDRIIFIKLDRFFRSVAEYHECMKYIDPVVWTATEEKYDLTTANGRAFVNMKLTIAELEADQTGERIAIVNDYKVKTGQPLTGAQSQGYGYTVKDKRVVKDPTTAPVVMDYVNHFLLHHNKRQAYLYVKDKYDLTVSYNTLSKVLTDPKLCGSYRGNEHYITDPYVDTDTYSTIQELLQHNIKVTASSRVYLFSGLITCPCCGSTLVGKFDGMITNKKPSGKTYTYYRGYYRYRCNKRVKEELCTYTSQIREDAIENALLDTFDQYITTYIKEATVTDARVDRSNDLIQKKITSVNTELAKVKRMYRKGDLTDEEYDTAIDELNTSLKALQASLQPLKKRDVKVYEDLLKTGWRGLYGALNRTNKRAFWHKYIKHLLLNIDGTIKEIIFF